MTTHIVRKSLYAVPCFVFVQVFSQQKITGKVTDENTIDLNSVLVVNISSNEKTYTNAFGQFEINAQENDEIRFIKDGYYRSDKKITKENINSPVNISLLKVATLIPEVKITYKPTGNLEKDSKHFDESKKIASLNSTMDTYMKSPLNKPLPNNSIPKTFKGHDFSTGQVDVIKLIGAAVGLVKKATQPKITKPNYIETQSFINKIKMEVNFDFAEKYGITKEQFDDFLIYANNTRELAKKFRKNFNLSVIESELKIAFLEYKKTHKVGNEKLK